MNWACGKCGKESKKQYIADLELHLVNGRPSYYGLWIYDTEKKKPNCIFEKTPKMKSNINYESFSVSIQGKSIGVCEECKDLVIKNAQSFKQLERVSPEILPDHGIYENLKQITEGR